jgi:hypothetical protein
VLDLLVVAERNAAYCRTDPTPALRADATLRGREASARFQRLLSSGEGEELAGETSR